MKTMNEISFENSCDLNIFFNLSEDVLCVINTSGYLEKVNEKFISESGIKHSDLFPGSFYQFIYPADESLVRESLCSISGHTEQEAEFNARVFFTHQNPQTYHWRARYHSGLIYLSAKATPLNKTKAEFDFLPATGSLKKPEKKQDASIFNEHRFKALVQNGSDLVAIITNDGDYKYVSPSVAHILGNEPSFYLGKNAFEFIHPDDIPALQAQLITVNQNYITKLKPYRFLHANGQFCWLETIVTNTIDDLEVDGLIVNSKDVTDWKEAEDELQKNNKRFDNLIENTKDGYFTLSRDWCFTSLNSTIRNMAGLPQGFVVNANLWDVFPNGMNLKFYAEFNRSFEENVPVQFEEFSPDFNKWLDFNAYPYENSLTVFVRDITELKIQQLTLSLEKEVLEMNASAAYSLKQLTDHLLGGFESIHYGLQTSLLFANRSHNKLYPLSIPSINEMYEFAREGVEIKLENGSCAMAAFNRREVYIEDVSTNPISENLREVLESYQVRSSRTIPIINKNDEILAVLTIFNRKKDQALTDETRLINRLGTIVQLLVEGRQTKKEIELNHERYQLTIQATSDSIWDLDMRTNQLYRGNGFDKYHNQSAGLEPLELKKWGANIHPDDAERVDKSLEDALNDKTTNKWTDDYRYLKKDGSYAIVIDKGFIVRDRAGKPVRIVGALQDVTEIKKNQAKLIQSEENYKNIFSENPTPMWTYDMGNEQFSMVNDAALELYGYGREEFLKLNLFDIRPVEEHERLREHLNKNPFVENKKISAEWIHLKKDKTRVTVETISHEVEINGRKSRLVTIKDITERKLAQEEILGQNQRLREIAQISSHETRKPLASILGLVSLFDKINLDSSLNLEIIQYLEITANELDQVIHEIVKKTWKEDETLPGKN